MSEIKIFWKLRASVKRANHCNNSNNLIVWKTKCFVNVLQSIFYICFVFKILKTLKLNNLQRKKNTFHIKLLVKRI